MAAETIYRALFLQARGGLKREVEAVLRARRDAGLTATQAGALRLRPHGPRSPRTARRSTGQGQIPDMVSIWRAALDHRPGGELASRPPRGRPDRGHGQQVRDRHDRGTCMATCGCYTYRMGTPPPTSAPRSVGAAPALARGVEADPHLGPVAKDEPDARRSASTPACRSDFADPHTPWLGSAARTSTGCCGSTSPKAPTCRSTRAAQAANASPTRSTTDPGPALATLNRSS